jgi:diaminopropionate ammonia-lyase
MWEGPRVRSLVNAAFDPAAVRRPSGAAASFHAALPGYAPTPLRALPALAAELGLGKVALKDESRRLGLPAFKVLGASWAVECAVREDPGIHTLVAASAGNHGRAVAHVAAARGLAARIHLPARSAAARREAIAAEGAAVIVAEGPYEKAVDRAHGEARAGGVLEVADVGDAPAAHHVIDGYATLFAEIAAVDAVDLVLVPTGVGSLAAAAARFGAQAGTKVIAVEPVAAACLTASLAAGRPTVVEHPGTTMAGLDCAEVSPAAWPDLRAGVLGTITVADPEAHAAMRELARAGLEIGDCGAATIPALRALATERACKALRAAARLRADSRVVLLATEGPTDREGYDRAVAGL